MKLPLRYFILACLLLGAIGVPWAWRAYQARRAAEIERLEWELAKLWKAPPLLNAIGHSQRRRMIEIEDRLEKITGKRPLRPEPEIDWDGIPPDQSWIGSGPLPRPADYGKFPTGGKRRP